MKAQLERPGTTGISWNDGPYVVFVGHGSQVVEFASMARALKARGIASHFWAFDPADSRTARSTADFSRVVNLLEGFQRGHPADRRYLEIIDALRDLEVGDGSTFWHEDAAFDRHLTGLSDPAIRYVKNRSKWTRQDIAFLTWTAHLAVLKELSVVRPLAVFGETNTLRYRVVHRAVTREGIVHLRPETPGHLDRRVHFEDDLRSKGRWCIEVYAELGRGPLPPEAAAWATAKVKDIRDHHVKPGYTQGVARGARRLWSRFNITTIRGSMRSWTTARTAESRHSPLGVAPEVVSPLGKLKRGITLEYRRRFYQSVTTRQLPTERFACYFLHVQPEFSVEGLAFAFQDQVAQIRNIVAGLPANMVLAVKEHRPMAGRRSVDFYGELASVPNVVIVDDTVDSITLIKQSEVVFTLTGTVAIEAMCCGIPAVIFGDIYYDAFDGIERAATIDDVADMFAGPVALTAATEAEAVRAMASRFLASYPGDFPPRPDDTENADLLADAIGAELSRRGIWGVKPTPRPTALR